MRSLRLALGFLTVIPSGAPADSDHRDFAWARAWFPLVGLLVGCAWAGTAWVLDRTGLPPGVRGAFLLAVPLLLTGFLHLDGLLDCADALMGSHPPARRLEILKDVHLGSFAFGAGALWILCTWQILSSRAVPAELLGIPVLSRGLLLVPMHVFPYARPTGPRSHSGTALPPAGWILPVACVALAAAFLPREAAAVLATQFAVAFLAARRLGGGVTGDVYGAMICLSETAALLAALSRSLP